MADASKDLFDAVIVFDPSRWSRDNKLNKEGLNILRKNSIRFFLVPQNTICLALKRRYSLV